MFKNLIFAVLAILSLAGSGAAQTVSFDDFEAAVDARTADLDRFAAVLSDPDPNRRIAAIEFMIASDDPVLKRLAKRTGLFSPDSAVRATTLKAIFDSLPTLEFRIGPPKELTDDFRTSFERVGDTIAKDGTGFLLHKIDKYDKKVECYFAERQCFSRLSGETVSFNLINYAGRRRWAGFQLNREGVLAGEAILGKQTVEVRVPLVE